MLTRWRGAARLFARAIFLSIAAMPALAGTAAAAVPGRIDPGNTAWVLAASALVLFMTLPGLALFYGGLVRERNLLSVLMHCFAIACVVSVLWAIFGYSLAFAPGNPVIGSFAKVLFAGAGKTVVPNGLPEGAYILFQMTFAVITPALVIGAFVERVRFGFVVAFAALWLVFVYLPVAHWVWGGGWAASLGTVDFAGGIVVHTTAGISALVTALLVGPRNGFPHHLSPPHSPGLTMAGAGMLWVGWFGFNGGSALAADSTAASAILATQLAAAAGGLTWMAVEWLRLRKPTSVGIVTGSVAGLATITPASGFVGPGGAMLLGAIAGIVCFFATAFVKGRLRVDDSLDVFAVHGIGGMTGSLLVAVFALPALGGVGYAGGMGPGRQFLAQLAALAAAVTWSALATWVIFRVIDLAIGVRVSREEERDGLDLSAHGERAYDMT